MEIEKRSYEGQGEKKRKKIVQEKKKWVHEWSKKKKKKVKNWGKFMREDQKFWKETIVTV